MNDTQQGQYATEDILALGPTQPPNQFAAQQLSPRIQQMKYEAAPHPAFRVGVRNTMEAYIHFIIPLHGAMMKHMDSVFILPIRERILPGECSLCSVVSLTFQNSAFQTFFFRIPLSQYKKCMRTIRYCKINAYFQDIGLQGYFAVET